MVFAIKHQAGAKYSWEYIMEFGLNANNLLTLKMITKVCSYAGCDKKVEYGLQQFWAFLFSGKFIPLCITHCSLLNSYLSR